MGAAGRCLEIKRAVLPNSLNATMALAVVAAAAEDAAVHMASGSVILPKSL